LLTGSLALLGVRRDGPLVVREATKVTNVPRDDRHPDPHFEAEMKDAGLMRGGDCCGSTSVTWAASPFGPTIYYRCMNLQSLLVCSDDRTVSVLRQVLDELEIGVEHCAHPTPAQKKLARQTFEAVIVDCVGEPSL
jgi:hypothetical protein